MNINGIGASSGIGIGPVFRLEEKELLIIEDAPSTEIEKAIMEASLVSAKEAINALIVTAKKTLGEKDANIFTAHLMFLEDPEFLSAINLLIESGKTAAFSIETVRNTFVDLFQSIDDDYMKERASDIKDVADRLLHIILEVDCHETFEHPVIIIAEDLTPSMTVSLDPDMVLGFITRVGGKTSHSAIMARNMGIPAVVGLTNSAALQAGDLVIIDGDTGSVILSPSQIELEQARQKKDQYDERKKLLNEYIGKATVTQDGKSIELVCNIGSDKDIPLVLSNDGEGVGLFRSEFLYMDQEYMPSEELQYQSYKKVLESIDGPIIIRTLDVGGDKNIPYIQLEEEMNPFLGMRAIRLCLKDSDLFQPQLLALLRASVHGNLKIMFPMVSSLEEVRLIKDQLSQAKETLRKREQAFKDVEIGIMIEIPAAALIADILAKEVDFFSIGTNDLVQYTTATDRMNQHLTHLYTHYHPAVLRLIHQVSQAGLKAGIPVGMCGEAASDELLLPFLIGTGLGELSVAPGKVLDVRQGISRLNSEKCRQIVEKILTLSDACSVRDYLVSLFSTSKV